MSRIIDEFVRFTSYKGLEDVKVSITKDTKTWCVKMDNIVVKCKAIGIGDAVVLINRIKLIQFCVECFSLTRICANFAKLTGNDNDFLSIKTEIIY